MGITSEANFKVYELNMKELSFFIGNVCVEKDDEPWSKWFVAFNKMLMSDELIFEVLKFADPMSRERILKKNYMDYNAYLKTEYWKSKSQKLKIKIGKCQACSSTEKLEVHHNNYDCLFGETELDLIVLCHKCHSKFHDKEEE